MKSLRSGGIFGGKNWPKLGDKNKDAHISKQNICPGARNCPKVLLQGICLHFQQLQTCHHLGKASIEKKHF